MNLNRRKFLRMVGIGTGAAIAAPAFALIPEPQIEPVLTAEEIVERLREAVYDSLLNTNYHQAISRCDSFGEAFFPTVVVTPEQTGVLV